MRARSQRESAAVIDMVLAVDAHPDDGIVALPVGRQRVVAVRHAVVLVPATRLVLDGLHNADRAVAEVDRPITEDVAGDADEPRKRPAGPGVARKGDAGERERCNERRVATGVAPRA